ncbi:hypothetical protein B0T26DRAFT_124649 [Lasiosphaeria miniovina]|uniref:AAA+ ATPase domain-containing protein n=1 Tax=Lasiosphaeria miniovina TaxID=1954250 RepID=A0AA40B3Z9_9PEZI|nr:uncharacterized protein B0T26DRAFT_124649 [Lasiosphaeria miniovina]KAK0727242.1 hypothetical protein B0T26DRAFT_124649 [Lasiosphaeria miniovina]
MAAETVNGEAAVMLNPKGTPQIAVTEVDANENAKESVENENEKKENAGYEKLIELLRRIEELEKSIGELKTTKDEKDAKEEEVKEEVKDEEAKEDEAKEDEDEAKEEEAEKTTEDDDESQPSFGMLVDVRLALFDPMKLTSDVVNTTEDLKKYAITAFYDVPTSAVNNLGAWKEGSQTPEYLPSRVSINSKRILELLKTITDTTMNDAPCVIVPPFKIFAAYWTEIEAKAKQLQDEFAEKYGHQWNVDPPKDETPKPRPLSEEEATREADKKNDRQDAKHLKCLVDFMAKYLSDIPRLRERIKSNEIESISFDDLWHLFNPGDIILGRRPSGKGEQQAYQVFTVTKGRFNMKGGRPEPSKYKGQRERNNLQLQCFSLDYDGKKIDTCEELLSIKPFVGKKKITDLDYYPKAFATDKEIKDLEDRASDFIGNRYGHGRCEGLTARFEMEHIDNEEVFVDFKSGYEEIPADWKQETCNFSAVTPPDCASDETYEPGCASETCTSCSNCVYLDEQVDIKRAEMVRDKMPKLVLERNINNTLKSAPERLLLPGHLLVYTLRTKKWHFVNVGDFEKITVTPEKIKEGWKNLVIESENKRLLKALVSDHSTTTTVGKKGNLSRSGSAIDIVRGKGRGRIVFLYGPPGVGKTSTAETIAAYTSPPRPLYPITCGDLGSEPKAIQEALEGHFKLAHRWNCVLLLDEADVYLAERHHNDLDRNGIVSVFLRTLEYYSGLLFLTSNRVGSIDPAFKSRIHVALRYEKINIKGTIEIWSNILNGIDKDNSEPHIRVKIEYDRDELLEWAQRHYERMEKKEVPTWNGRQIRNAFQSAIALASHARLENLRKNNLTEEMAMKHKNPRWKKIDLLKKHFNDVSKIVYKFEDYREYFRSFSPSKPLFVCTYIVLHVYPEGKQVSQLTNFLPCSDRVRKGRRQGGQGRPAGGRCGNPPPAGLWARCQRHGQSKAAAEDGQGQAHASPVSQWDQE